MRKIGSMERKMLDVLSEPTNGHPSRQEQIRISRLENMLIELAKEIDYLNWKTPTIQNP